MNKIYYLIFLFLGVFIVDTSAQDNQCAGVTDNEGFTAYQEAKQALAKRDMNLALKKINFAKQYFEKIDCWEQAIRMSYNLAVLHSQLKDNKESTKEIFSAEKKALVHLPDSSFWYGKVLTFIGQHYMKRNSLDSAKMYLLQAKFIFNQRENWKDYVASCRILAQATYYEQNYRLMERYLNEAFRITKSKLSADKKNLRAILQLYGVLYYRTGDYETALERTQEGLDMALKSMKTKADTTLVASYYNNIGLFYIEIGDIDKAEDYCMNALLLSEKLNARYKVATIYTNLAEFFLKKEQYSKAYNYFRKGLENLDAVQKTTASKSDIDRTRIQQNIGLARTAAVLKKKDIALAALERNLIIHQREPYMLEMTQHNFGEYYFYFEDYEKAAEYLKKAEATAERLYTSGNHPNLAQIYFYLAKIKELQKDWAAVLSYLDKAISALTFDVAYGQKSKLSVVSDKRFLMDILEFKARVLEQKGDLNVAYELILKATDLAAELRNSFKSEGSRLFLLQRVIPVYERAVAIAYTIHQQNDDPSYLEKTFELFEQNKSMLLLDAVRAEDARAFGGVPENLLREEKRLARELAKKQKLLVESSKKSEIEQLQKDILKIKRKSVSLQDTLESKYYRYYKLKYDNKTPSIKEVQAALKKNTCFIEFFTGEEAIYWFSISKKEVRLHRLPKDNVLNKQVSALRLSLTKNEWLLEKDKIKELYQLFTQNAYPIFETYLKPALRSNTKELLIVPDGLFNYIPFDVLLTEKVSENDSDANFQKLPYLLKDLRTHYYYSASLMLYDRQKSKSNGRLLGFAPTFKYDNAYKGKNSRMHRIRSSVEELPGAKKEVETLSTLFKGTYLYNEAANEQAFRELTNDEVYGVIHLAMHGWVDEKRPEYSNLVFSDVADNGEDNLLFAYELNLLNLDADLVVLSACETGYGKYEHGEGVVSIGRGFMYAGIPSLVMTLWPINDQATAILITDFYNQLAKGKTKPEAMQLAKLNYIKRGSKVTAHPFFWASFITLGDESPIKIKRKGAARKWLIAAGIILLIAAVSFLLLRVRRRRSGKG